MSKNAYIVLGLIIAFIVGFVASLLMPDNQTLSLGIGLACGFIAGAAARNARK